MLKGYRLGQIRRGQIWRRTEIRHFIEFIHEHEHDCTADAANPLNRKSEATTRDSADIIFNTGNGDDHGTRSRKDGET